MTKKPDTPEIPNYTVWDLFSPKEKSEYSTIPYYSRQIFESLVQAQKIAFEGVISTMDPIDAVLLSKDFDEYLQVCKTQFIAKKEDFCKNDVISAIPHNLWVMTVRRMDESTPYDPNSIVRTAKMLGLNLKDFIKDLPS
ncbi:hypothetical protein GF340_00570 [Candidatus Peregrinibacteria bacterium]|nr:hypothetical protein [Candidatus Peregrinibacteria bacterium]